MHNNRGLAKVNRFAKGRRGEFLESRHLFTTLVGQDDFSRKIRGPTNWKQQYKGIMLHHQPKV